MVQQNARLPLPIIDFRPFRYASVPIGRAFEEECLAIINEQGELMRFESAPEGYRGELLLSGKQLVNGYLNDPLNTQSAFFQHEGVFGIVQVTLSLNQMAC